MEHTNRQTGEEEREKSDKRRRRGKEGGNIK
jgi:hypothetical protein